MTDHAPANLPEAPLVVLLLATDPLNRQADPGQLHARDSTMDSQSMDNVRDLVGAYG